VERERGKGRYLEDFEIGTRHFEGYCGGYGGLGLAGAKGMWSWSGDEVETLWRSFGDGPAIRELLSISHPASPHDPSACVNKHLGSYILVCA
jgi:hypothetical protein